MRLGLFRRGARFRFQPEAPECLGERIDLRRLLHLPGLRLES